METNLLITLSIISIISIILFGSLLFIYIINNQKTQGKQLRVPIFGMSEERANIYYNSYPERFSKKWRKRDK